MLAQFKIHPIRMKRDVLQEIEINKTRGQKLRESFLSLK
jgi:heme exporter protein D